MIKSHGKILVPNGSVAGSETAVKPIFREGVDQSSVSVDSVDYGSVRAEAVSGTPVKSRPLFLVREDEEKADSAQPADTVMSAKPMKLSVPPGFDFTPSERGRC